jgi:hypothetical protein
VVRGAEPVGIVTERDVVAHVADGAAGGTTVGDVMSAPVETIPVDRSLADAARRLVRENIRRLPVVDGDELVGLLTARDVLVVTTASTPDAVEAVAGAPNANQTGETARPPDPGSNGEPGGVGRAPRDATADADAEQGICERCGQLSHELAAVSGEVVCADCRAA